MMKNKSTLAKLLAEEDIFVVHKQMETAYFDVKKRELGLPIWKDEEMTPEIYDLMRCHEVGHALWTPLDMLERAKLRDINHSFVNIIEDARIEKKVKIKYPGAINLFNKGYTQLFAKNFFGTDNRPMDAFGLIDRINIFFKTGNKDISFSDEEKVWVDRVAAVNTEDEVLDLAEELYKWIEENPESQGVPSEEDGDADAMESMGSGADAGETGETGEDGAGEDGAGDTGKSDEELAKDFADAMESGDKDAMEKAFAEFEKKNFPDVDSEKKEGKENGNAGDNADGVDTDDGDADAKDGEGESSSEVGGKGESAGASGRPTLDAVTDSAFGKAMEALRDLEQKAMTYGRIPELKVTDYVEDFSICEKELTDWYNSHKDGCDLFFNSTLKEVDELKKENKKTVAYMVKEFEMKKSADQYARATVSKTGSLNMNKLHTYKFNDDLFNKVTTLPGATNHGLVIVVDWSGSMSENLKGTVAQLFNLVWFCRRTKIPFEVFAFSDQCRREVDQPFNDGYLKIRPFKMLNFLSSRMTVTQENNMLHNIWMMASRWGGYRDWNTLGYPIQPPKKYELGGTPLQEAVISLFEIIPAFVKDTGVQKVNTVFLTDGAGSNIDTVDDLKLATEGENKGTHYKSSELLGLPCTITDPKTRKTVVKMGDGYAARWTRRIDTMPVLMELLKKRIPNMNVVGFFIAGNYKGNISRYDLAYICRGTNILEADARKKLKKDKYLETTQQGFDKWFVLPGGTSLMTENADLDDALVGASKAKLKTAFGKSMKGRITSRQMLNKFIQMVA